MRSETIARNYAEALFDLGERSGDTGRYADLMDALAAAIETTPSVQAILMSPRIPKGEKSRLLGAALKDTPREFVLFLQAVVKRGRQQLFREIATEYLGLLDVKLNRVRAGVTLARPANEQLQRSIAEALSQSSGEGSAALVLGRSGDPGRRDRAGGRADPRRLAPAAAGQAAAAPAGEVAREAVRRASDERRRPAPTASPSHPAPPTPFAPRPT